MDKKKEVISLYNNRINATEPSELYIEKLLSSMRFDRIFVEIVERLDKTSKTKKGAEVSAP
ncbi:MAG: hypothetical protein C4527_18280 [Candidatus Omnitrophota bacterium]|jgi:hypothetical protein|nr:MAG: hypothetical protein C4527_18280 [Candidatus Omnitrophota bacterium]